ncbi:triacylglycerol lipase, partial [Ancylostoma duodenale]
MVLNRTLFTTSDLRHALYQKAGQDVIVRSVIMYLIILLLPTLGACIGYWDFLAKRISLPLSAALYSPDPESCLQDRVGAYSVEKFMAKVDGGSVSGLIVTIPFLQTVALSFMADISEPTDFNSFKELFFPLITGHSFGGALAALVAVDIIKKGLAKKDTVTLITLGQSMVGDKDFAKEYEEEVRDSYRVVRRGDSIPHVPGREHGYEFNGRE